MVELNKVKIDTGVLETAADYYLALQDGTMTATGLQDWQLWLAASDEHRRAFARLESLWGVLADVPAEMLEPAATVENTAPADAAPARAGASVLGLVAPAGKARVSRIRTAAWMTGMAASVAAVFLAGYLMFASAPGADLPAPISFATGHGDGRVVNLADGSIVELGPDSKLSVDYSSDERRLSLETGQAVFTVAKNPRRPFVVEAAGGSVTAIGTVFNVRRHAADVEVRV
ncbi:MAG: DUF4880 domain-containing protein, partial [Alphaproteobacteria bacterium]